MTSGQRLILASQSARRLRLLRQIGMVPEVVPSGVQEHFDLSKTPAGNARDLALEKANDVARSFKEGIVVGADTIVVLDDELLSKPADPAEAIRMLSRLSGRSHRVVTGIALVDCRTGQAVTATEETVVVFRKLDSEEIVRYVGGGSPMDKAGAYGIQDDYGAVFVSRIEGCYYNVVGFPLALFHLTMKTFTESLAKG